MLRPRRLELNDSRAKLNSKLGFETNWQEIVGGCSVLSNSVDQTMHQRVLAEQ